MKECDPVEELQRLVEKHGSQKAVAVRLGVSAPFVYDMLNKHRPVPDSVIAKLGLRVAVVKVVVKK